VFTWDKHFDTSYYIKSYENEFMYGASPTFKDSQQFRTHILIVNNKGVKLLGNEFYNLRRWQEWGIDIVNGYKYQRVQSGRRKGTGVFALSSTIYIGAKGPCYETSTNEPDCYKCYGKKSQFEGLYIGVLALNSVTIDPALQSIEVMDSKFHNNTNSIVAGAHSIGINTNLGTSLDKPVRNVYVSNCEFNTDNGYYYHEAIMSKNSTDIFLEEVVNYHIIKNKFIKEYDDPDRYNPTDQVCFGAYGAAYLGNIYIKNCSIYVPHGAGGNWGTLIYKNYFQNKPWVRCTSNFGSITFDGENVFTSNSVTDVPVECNYFNNSHPVGHVFGSVNDITFRPDANNGDVCLFTGYSFGSAGNPSHNKFTFWDSCNGLYDRNGYNFFFMPQNVTNTGGKWISNPSPIEYYYNTDASIFPQQNALQCVLDKGANHTRTGTTFSGSNGFQICYPQIYGKRCPKNSRQSEVLPASQNPNTESYSTFLVPPQAGNTGLQATTVFGVSVGPNPYSGGPLYVNYIFPNDVFYIVLYIYDAEGNLKTTLLLSKDSFDAEGKLRIDNLMNTLPPGTYYFTFKNSKGEWQTIIVQVQ
jgi:hypothetical protein